MLKRVYETERLSPEPHYFGVGVIGDSILDPNSAKNDRYCEILEYQEFERAVLAKMHGSYLERIPESRASNYWRFGVREISQAVYDGICGNATIIGYMPTLPHPNGDFESYHTDGEKMYRYSAYYERNPFYRARAIEIHGLSCMACGMEFGSTYGKWGEGYIHVHHNRPVSESGPTRIIPEADLSVVCPNCHAMIHRKKDLTLSIQEVRKLIGTSS